MVVVGRRVDALDRAANLAWRASVAAQAAVTEVIGGVSAGFVAAGLAGPACMAGAWPHEPQLAASVAVLVQAPNGS
jgi:hypothetical protein